MYCNFLFSPTDDDYVNGDGEDTLDAPVITDSGVSENYVPSEQCLTVTFCDNNNYVIF